MDPPGGAETAGEAEEPGASLSSLKSCFSQGLKQLHHTQALCDATLVAGGKRFPCNRALLASVSPYFQAVFSGGFKESRDGEVLLKDMDPGVLQDLLSYLYSGELALRPESAEDVFTAASRLQLTPALALVSRYLVENLSLESCLRLYTLAHDHNNHSLLRGTLDYLGAHFETLSQHQDFPRLDLEALVRIVSSDHLAVASEMDIFQAMQSWVAAAAPGRLRALRPLLRHLRFPLLSQEEVPKLQAALARLDPQAELQWEDLDGAGRLQQSGGLRQGMYRERVVCLKVPRPRDILSADGEADCYVECLDPATGSRAKLPPLGLVVLPGCSALEHRLYVSGGKHPDGSYARALHEYSSLADRWRQLPAMATPRSLHVLLACRRKLFALGGWNDAGPLASAERFDVAREAWAPIARVPLALRFCASASYKDKLYLIGGDADSQEAAAYRGVLIYNLHGDAWVQVPLDVCLHGASAVPLGAGICVIGGFSSRTATHLPPNRALGQLLPCTSRSFFLLESGVVSKEVSIPLLPLPLAFAGATLFQGRVYLLGGVCASRTHDAIYHWAPGEAAWTECPESLTERGDIVRRVLKCLTLQVPKPTLGALLHEAGFSRAAVGLAEPKAPSEDPGGAETP